jgi:hypothetical protein
MGLGNYLRGRAQGNMLPSQGRSALVAQLLQQSMQPNPGSMSPVESLNIAAKPILAALLSKQEDKARTTQQQALAGALSRSQLPGAQGEAARRASTIIAGGSPDSPLAQQVLGMQAENVFAPSGGESFTLSTGQTRYDASGKQVAQAPANATTTDVPTLVNEITDDLYKESQTFSVQLANIGNVRASLADRSPAGDMGLVYGYMKMLDPTSAVREAEYATAENARGVPASIRNVWNRLQNGQRLDEDQRRDFSNRAERYFAQERANQGRRNERFLARATGAGIPKEMFSQYLLPLDPSQVSAQPASPVPGPPQPTPTPIGPPRRVIQ